MGFHGCLLPGIVPQVDAPTALQALQPNLIRKRLNRYGQTGGVKVWPYRPRHTLATQLLNQGMPITSIQRYPTHPMVCLTAALVL